MRTTRRSSTSGLSTVPPIWQRSSTGCPTAQRRSSTACTVSRASREPRRELLMEESAPIAREFVVDIPQSDLDDLMERLRRTRFVDDIDNDDWTYGLPTAFLRELVEHWTSSFDWRAIERDVLNACPQYRVELDGFPIHFLHVRGIGPDPIPNVLSHGWPWVP